MGKAAVTVGVAFRPEQPGKHLVEFTLPGSITRLRRFAEGLMAKVRPAVKAAQEAAHLPQTDLQAARAPLPAFLRKGCGQAIRELLIAQTVPRRSLRL